MKTSRILITGASGFIGSYITRALLSSHHDIHILLRNEANTWRIRDILPQLFVHKANMNDLKKLSMILHSIKPDYIFHFAAHGAYATQTNVEEMIKTNIIALSHLLEATKDIDYKCFVNTGSSSEYGYKNRPMKETDLLEPDSFYAATKSSATLLAQVFGKKYNKPVITFRLFSVFGPYEDPSRLIPTAMTAALAGRPLNITPGVVKRDFIYVGDVFKAYLATLKRKIVPGEIYNIGTGKQTSNDQLASMIKKINNNSLTIHKGDYPQRSWDTSYWVANIKHTQDSLQWKPTYTLREGLEETYKWFRDNVERYQKIYGEI